ncbi:hypothetical protein B0J13DRAFT_539583 [Dactylonectria estremocensis]|uniref:Uncharacterized protein n=1 Tax=Dactylonectria estremocensis TaxID=1079267 RepID=A0A9P9FE09_9HYPO|nr:hypothetical protein B0J13DRAFT_539583 [Dactylonectria estremocensis]
MPLRLLTASAAAATITAASSASTSIASMVSSSVVTSAKAPARVMVMTVARASSVSSVVWLACRVSARLRHDGPGIVVVDVRRAVLLASRETGETHAGRMCGF